MSSDSKTLQSSALDPIRLMLPLAIKQKRNKLFWDPGAAYEPLLHTKPGSKQEVF